MAPMIGHDNATPIVSVGSATVLKWRVSGGGGGTQYMHIQGGTSDAFGSKYCQK